MARSLAGSQLLRHGESVPDLCMDISQQGVHTSGVGGRRRRQGRERGRRNQRFRRAATCIPTMMVEILLRPQEGQLMRAFCGETLGLGLVHGWIESLRLTPNTSGPWIRCWANVEDGHGPQLEVCPRGPGAHVDFRQAWGSTQDPEVLPCSGSPSLGTARSAASLEVLRYWSAPPCVEELRVRRLMFWRRAVVVLKVHQRRIAAVFGAFAGEPSLGACRAPMEGGSSSPLLWRLADDFKHFWQCCKLRSGWSQKCERRCCTPNGTRLTPEMTSQLWVRLMLTASTRQRNGAPCSRACPTHKQHITDTPSHHRHLSRDHHLQSVSVLSTGPLMHQHSLPSGSCPRRRRMAWSVSSHWALSHLLMSTVSSVNFWLQTLTLCKTTLWCTQLAKSEADMAELVWALRRAAASNGQGSSVSPRRLTKGATKDGASHSDVGNAVSGQRSLVLVDAVQVQAMRGDSQKYHTEVAEFKGDATRLAQLGPPFLHVFRADQGNADGDRALRRGRGVRQDVLGGVGLEGGRDGVGGSSSPLQVPQHQKTGGEKRAGERNIGVRPPGARARESGKRGTSRCRRSAESRPAFEGAVGKGSRSQIASIRVVAEPLESRQIPADRATAWRHEGHGAVLALGGNVALPRDESGGWRLGPRIARSRQTRQVAKWSGALFCSQLTRQGPWMMQKQRGGATRRRAFRIPLSLAGGCYTSSSVAVTSTFLCHAVPAIIQSFACCRRHRFQGEGVWVWGGSNPPNPTLV